MAGPLEILNERGLEAIGRYYSIYRGVVVDNKDPEGLGRVKVTVPQFDNTVAEWAYPKGQEGALQTGFRYFTPKIGQIVFIEFECGDPLYPIWSYAGWGTGEMPSEFKDPDTMGIVTPSSHKVILKDKEGTLTITIADEKEREVTKLELNQEEVIIKSKVIKLMGARQGITLTDMLLTKLNKLEIELNTLKASLQTAVNVAVPTDGGRAAFTSLQPWASVKLKLTSMEDIESKEVLQ